MTAPCCSSCCQNSSPTTNAGHAAVKHGAIQRTSSLMYTCMQLTCLTCRVTSQWPRLTCAARIHCKRWHHVETCAASKAAAARSTQQHPPRRPGMPAASPATACYSTPRALQPPASAAAAALRARWLQLQKQQQPAMQVTALQCTKNEVSEDIFRKFTNTLLQVPCESPEL
jgi:hypothetical protein